MNKEKDPYGDEFKKALEDNAKHVDSWPQWKKEGWYLLDLKGPKCCRCGKEINPVYPGDSSEHNQCPTI